MIFPIFSRASGLRKLSAPLLAVLFAAGLVSSGGVVRAQDGTLDVAYTPAGAQYFTGNLGGDYSDVQILAPQPDGKLYVAGRFNMFDSRGRNGLARLNADGSVDETFNPELTASSGLSVNLAVQLDGKVLYSRWLGDDSTEPRVIRINPDGSPDAGFSFRDGGTLTYPISALALLPDGKILVSGNAPYENGTSGGLLERFHPDGSLDTAFAATSTDAAVTTIAVLPDGKILVGGGFRSLNHAPAFRLARLNADGSLDGGFVSHLSPGDSEPEKLVLQPDGKILAGGVEFTTADGEESGVVRFNPDGSFDTSFATRGPLNHASASSLVLQADGKIIVSSQGQRVVRLNADGTQDDTFTPASINTVRIGYPQTYDFGGISSLALTTEGKVLLGGIFSGVNGVSRLGLARLNNAAPSVPLPQITGPGSANGVATVAFRYQIAATNNALSYAVSSLPDGLVIDALTGVISGVPVTPGVYPLIVAATNAAGTTRGALTVNVSPAPVPTPAPVVTSATRASARTGQAFTYRITAANHPTSYAASGLPAGLSVDATTGLISGTPTADGAFTVTLSAANAGGAGTSKLALTVVLETPVVSLVVPEANGGNRTQILEGGASLKLKVVRTTTDLSRPLTVHYKVKGGNVPGVDYRILSGTVTIPAGAAGARIKVRALDDEAVDGNKTLKIKLLPVTDDSYQLGAPAQAKIHIIDLQGLH